MKLYFSPGACSLAPHIVIRELGLAVELEKADLGTKRTASGADFLTINPKGQVPTLVLDDGRILTEGPVIVQYLADRKPEVGLLSGAGTLERYRVQEELNFIASELHKSFSPLFRKETPEDFKKIGRNNLANKYRIIDAELAGKAYLMGDRLTVADSYLFTVTRWAEPTGIDLAGFPHVLAFQKRMADRPRVRDALQEEGLSG